MKRIIALLLTLLMLFTLLAACGKEETIDLDAVYQNIMAAQADNPIPLVLFPESNPEFIEGCYPGLSAIELNQQVYYAPPIFGFGCEILLLELADKRDAKVAEAILQARIDAGASDTSYTENAEAWATRAQIQQSGRYLCMIVLPNGYVIPENVFDLG